MVELENRIMSCIRIGNLTFKQPREAIWNNAISIANSLDDIITHITLEQRQCYTMQQNRSCALTAVRKCGLRQEFVTSGIDVANIIKNSTLKETEILTEQNTWRRKIYERLLEKLDGRIKTLASYRPKTLTPKKKTTPDARVTGAIPRIDFALPPVPLPPSKDRPPPPPSRSIRANNDKGNSNNNSSKKQKQIILATKTARAKELARISSNALAEAKAANAEALAARADMAPEKTKKRKYKRGKSRNNKKKTTATETAKN